MFSFEILLYVNETYAWFSLHELIVLSTNLLLIFIHDSISKKGSIT